MKIQKIQLKEGSYVKIPKVVVDLIMSHKSEIIITWEQMVRHFENCQDDCFEVWCKLQTGSTPHENLKALDRYVKHVGQLPPDWGNLFHHQIVCEDCNKEGQHAKSSDS